MADSDSFINEVTEEVRRDKLYGLLRRWGWLAALVVLGIVGTAAFLEYRRAQDQAVSQAFGDALLAALDAADPQARIDALAAIDPATPRAGMILALLESGERADGGDPAAAAQGLRAAAETPGIERRYRDLALLRAEMLDPSEPSQARIILSALAEPGAPYAGLAQEQLALLALRTGDTDGALALFRQIEAQAATTPGLQQRASQLIVAIEAGSTLVDSLPDTGGPREADPVPADDAGDAVPETDPDAASDDATVPESE